MATKLFPSNLSRATLLVVAITLFSLPTHLLATTVRTNWAAAGTYTWTCPAGVTSVQVEVWGGGGQGGNVHVARSSGSYTASAGGGGGGAYAKKSAMPVTAGNSYTITIPAAANDTTDIANGNHHDGAGVGFTNLVTDSGGQISVFAGGGTGGTNYNGNVGGSITGGGAGSSTTSGADASQNGGNGATAVSSGGGGGGGAGDNGAGATATTGTGAAGGSGINQSGGGGGTGAATSANGGAAQTGPGGGGGGSRTTANSGNQNPTVYGGAGGVGMIVLTYNDPNLNLSTNAFLKSLVLTPAGTLSPAFATNTYSYTASEAAGNTPTVTVTNADLTASNALFLDGSFVATLTSGVPSSALTLSAGIHTIAVQVTAQDGLTVKTYTVNETQASAGPYYWDGNNSTAGFGTAGGTWAAPTVGTTTNGWSANSSGTATVNGNSVLTGIGDALNFGTASAGLAAGNITVSGTVNAGSLTYGSASGNITLAGGQIILGATAGITNNGATQTINAQLSGAGNSLTFDGGSCNFGGGGAGANTTTGDLYLVGGGTMLFNAANTGWGAGKNAFIVNGTTVKFNSSAGDGLGGSSGYTLNLGDSSGTAGGIYIANSATCANPIVVPAGSVGSSISLYDNNGTPSVSGNITAHDDLRISFGAAYAAGKNPVISGTACSIDSGATVFFALTTSANGDKLTDSAIWSGQGSISYSSSAPAGSTAYFLITGAKTYSGGAAVTGFQNGYAVVKGSSTGSPNSVTSGPFGTGTLTLDTCTLEADTSGDSILGNPVVLAGNVTFPTVASEKSLVFQGSVDLADATPTIINNVGSTVTGKSVAFQGVMSSSYPGVGLTLAGTGVTRLSGANIYPGDTTISSGTTQLGTNNVIPDGVGVGDVYVNGTLDLNGFSDTINGLNGAGIVDNTLAGSSSTLTAGNNDASGTFSGTITNSGSGATLALVKIGNGALTLSGANTYSAATTVIGGALLVNGSIGAGNVIVSGANTTLGGTGTIGGALTLNTGGILQPTLAGASGGTLTLSSATSPSFASGCTLQIRAPSSVVDKLVLSDPSPVFSCGNLNLVIDTSGLSSNLTGVPIVSVAKSSGGISGTFASVTANNGCAVTVHYNAQSITVDLQPAPLLATKLVFTSARFTNTAGFISSPITVQRQNNSGTPITSDRTIFVSLASSSGTNAVFVPALLTISNGTSSATFTYTDNQNGTPTITAASSPLTNATQQETIVLPPPPSPLDPAALAARKLAALTNEYNNPWPDPSTSIIGQAEYCVAAYTLNMGLTRADNYVLGWNNANTGSFEMINIDRIFADPVLNGRMGYAARTNLQTVMWNYLYAHSLVSDSTNVWSIDGSENLNLIKRSSCYLIAQVLQNTPGYTNKVMSDGKTIQQHVSAWAAYFRKYFWSRARKGGEVEMNSNTYTKYTLSCMYNLYDLTTDPVVKANGLNYLNLYWAEKAQSFLATAGVVGGSQTRSYKQYMNGDSFTSATYFLGWNNIGYSGHPGEQMSMVTKYSCPDTISALALYPKGRFKAVHSTWGEGTSTSGPLIYKITFESDGSGGAVRVNFATEAYVMSATCYRPDRNFVAEATQNRLMGVNFNNGSDRIIMNGLGTSQGVNESGTYEVNGVAGTNCVILWRDPKVSSSSAERLFLSTGSVVNNLVTNGNWQFTKSANAYAAILIANGGWTTGTDPNVGGGVMQTLNDPWSPVIIECAPASDYASFAAFTNKILSNAFSTNASGATYSVSYTSSAGDQYVVYANSSTFPKLNGVNFSYTVPQTYVSPYLNGLGTSDTGTVTYSNYAAVTLSFLTNSPPTLAAITNYTLMAGQTLRFTNSASDSNIPPLTLAYSLAGAPAGATVNATNGVFIWRPAIAQSPSINTMAVVVTGNSTAALSDTKIFTVTVTNPPLPTCSAPKLTNGVFSVQINGATGPDYLIQASTNLANPLAWQTVLTNTSPPFVFQDYATTNYPNRFYRVLLGP